MDKSKIEADIKGKTVKDVKIFIEKCLLEEELDFVLQYENKTKARKGVIEAVKLRKIKLGFSVGKKPALKGVQGTWSPEKEIKGTWSPEKEIKGTWSP